MLFTPVHQSLGKEARHFPSPYDGQGRASASVENSLPSLSPELHLESNQPFPRLVANSLNPWPNRRC